MSGPVRNMAFQRPMADRSFDEMFATASDTEGWSGEVNEFFKVAVDGGFPTKGGLLEDPLPGELVTSGMKEARLLLLGGDYGEFSLPKGFRLLTNEMKITQVLGAILRQVSILERAQRLFDSGGGDTSYRGPQDDKDEKPTNLWTRVWRAIFNLGKLGALAAGFGFLGASGIRKMWELKEAMEAVTAEPTLLTGDIGGVLEMSLGVFISCAKGCWTDAVLSLEDVGFAHGFATALAALVAAGGLIIGAYLAA